MGSDHPTQPVTLYTQPGCAECAKVRAWLVEHGTPFTERDAGRDPAAAAALVATGAFATPLLVFGSETVLGFRDAALAALLGDGDKPQTTSDTGDAT